MGGLGFDLGVSCGVVVVCVYFMNWGLRVFGQPWNGWVFCQGAFIYRVFAGLRRGVGVLGCCGVVMLGVVGLLLGVLCLGWGEVWGLGVGGVWGCGVWGGARVSVG